MQQFCYCCSASFHCQYGELIFICAVQPQNKKERLSEEQRDENSRDLQTLWWMFKFGTYDGWGPNGVCHSRNTLSELHIHSTMLTQHTWPCVFNNSVPLKLQFSLICGCVMCKSDTNVNCFYFSQLEQAVGISCTGTLLKDYKKLAWAQWIQIPTSTS